ncbi:Afadin and alpha-actinin-binding domain-containing protein [Trichoderma chlorosporum]
MIDTENLRTASLYINNQLLSRGLVRDGHDISFTDIRDAHTASRIIGVLNDLIIRRDRDAEQRESFSTTVINLRAENLKHTNDIARLSEKCTEAQRKSDIAVTSEALLKTQLKSAESVIKGLKDDLARTKGLVAQVRAACATETRRRDRQIETLKKQVGEAGRARGTKSGSGILSITVTGDVNCEEKKSPVQGGNLEDSDYSLRSETNAFLASLAQNLNEENEALLKVVQQAKDQLREMSGWSGEAKGDSDIDKPQGWAEMSSELGAVMHHMKTILTNPSFVPIEEVLMREEQIEHLKAAVLKMESRWEDTVLLMDGWRKRMATSGKPIGEDDILMGLLMSPVRVSGVKETNFVRERNLPAVQEEEEPEEDIYDDSEDEFSGFSADNDKDEMEAIEYDVEEQNVQMSGTEEPVVVTDDMEVSREPEQGPLQNSSSAGNRGPEQNTIRQKVGASTLSTARGPQQPAGSTSTGMAKNTSSRVTRSSLSQQQVPVAMKATDPKDGMRMETTTNLDEAQPSNINEKETDRRENGHSEEHGPAVGAASRAGNLRSIPRRVPVRLPQPRPKGARPLPASPSKTAIAAKLAASEKQADAARAREKLRALHTTGGAQRPTVASAAGPSRLTAAKSGAPAVGSAKGMSPVKREGVQPETRKRERRAAKVSSRRRSTLSPFELQSLISGNVE